MESLEDRMLLAVGPQLISIKPNDGGVLNDQDTLLDGPRSLEFVFNDRQIIDPNTLDGIRITRSGFDGAFGDVNDVVIKPGFIDIGENPNEIIVRFAETLPDDLYRIDIIGAGTEALANTSGDPFNNGVDASIEFDLDLGAQVVAVVPQPFQRETDGSLTQNKDQIVVYFNNDDLLDTAGSAENPDFYQLIFTNDTVDNLDDVVFVPDTVEYDSATDRATLTFASDIDQLSGAGTYRLRIGTDEGLPGAPTFTDVVVDPGSSFDTARDIGNIGAGGAESLIFGSAIDPQFFPLDLPGSIDEPGHREINAETHLLGSADGGSGSTTLFYNFQRDYGIDPSTGEGLINVITETQKQRAREIFQIYSNYAGLQFIESADQGLTIVTGDLRALDPEIETGEGGILGLAGGGLAIMDRAEPWNDAFGADWFTTAMHEIGHLLGQGHTYDLPPLTIQGSDPALAFGNSAEGVFPGDNDIVHLQYLHRPDSKDIDLYKFTLDTEGLFSAETTAERLPDSSLLDSVVNLYKENFDGTRELIARNDDYFSEDSYLEMQLGAGTYYLGVSASGNSDYDPSIEDTGFGGRTDGKYDLRFSFRPQVNNFLVDDTGRAFDGDADGQAGGVYNFWFRAQTDANTLIVDKTATAGGGGSILMPYDSIQDAIDASTNGDIVRIVGNGGTIEDATFYEVGFDVLDNELSDGGLIKVPKGVTLMIDAGAVFKMRNSSIQVGSFAPGLDRSGGALQVLGTPDAAVIFTSFQDNFDDADPDLPTSPRPGDWGGVRFRNDLDRAAGGFDYEALGIFLNYINHADMRFAGGGGDAPIEMTDARPTVSFNTISKSAGAAMSATPNSFEESNFNAPQFQAIPFTSDYDRIGPDINGNLLIDNTTNGLFVRIQTPAGQELRSLTVSARFDDIDIVHVISENLTIAGTASGPIVDNILSPQVGLTAVVGEAGGSLAAGTYNYRIVFVDRNGFESPASAVTSSATIAGGPGEGSIRLDNLPAINDNASGTARFVSLRIYRSDSSAGGPYVLVGQAFGTETTFLDDGTTATRVLDDSPGKLRARQDARLAIDAGTIVKMDGARLDVTMGAQLLVEASDGQEVVFTSLLDDSFGAGGTFDTNADQDQNAPAGGDWGGIYIGQTSTASIDNAVFAYGGGSTTIEGGFASFNVVEIHQADVRIANSTFMENASGQGSGNRAGRGSNASATIFVRGAQPILVDNVVRDNTGPAININVNSLNHLLNPDFGRSTGQIDLVEDSQENQGPLIRGNRLDGNGINGMVVRGGTLTTQSVWDDTDIVHVVLNEIVVPDLHTYGGLRLESSPTESLVVKLQGADAGFTATGRPLEITDRIGGSVQIVGQAAFPVVLTALSDDSVGAGFRPDGRPQVDTNGDGLNFREQDNLPIGPEVDSGTIIDNDVAPGIVGQFSFDVGDGGVNGFNGVRATAQGETALAINEEFVFDFINFIDVGANGGGIGLQNTTITMPATLIASDLVASEGTFDGENGLVTWRVETQIDDGDTKLFNTLSLSSDNPLGAIRFINYLDQDVFAVDDDLLQPVGTPGQDGFEVFILDGVERIGFSQGGVYQSGEGLENATYVGWGADQYSDLIDNIETTGTTFSVDGIIDTTDLTPFNDPELGDVFGLADVTAAFAWDVDPTATTATIRTFLDLIPENPAPGAQPTAGDWRSIRLDQFGNDRNVEVITEMEAPDVTAPGTNATPDSSQFLGLLAPTESDGDDNLRLGFEVHGFLTEPADLDVYSFSGQAGTEIWIDIDRTTQSLDTVVELLDDDGNVLASSDNSLLESADPSLLGGDGLPMQAVVPFKGQDFWSSNPLDAGMRVVLPGPTDSTSIYHVRVRSAPSSGGGIDDGQTSGVYQLQIRLRETDEVPGSTVRYADIRYATNGIEVLGGPIHSILVGEATETTGPNDTSANAQNLGNIFNTDRGALGVSGLLEGASDVDWFQYEVRYDAIQGTNKEPLHASLVFDLDYAAGLARANTIISVFNSSGQLILTSRDSNIADDQPAPQSAGNIDEISNPSQGSFGNSDPFIGTVEIPEGTYFIAVTSNGQVPQEVQQFLVRDPVNPLVRLEPVNSIRRIAEDHIGSSGGSTADPPQVETLLDSTNVVPFNLGDVVLFVSRDTGGQVDTTELATVDPFTGALETSVRLDARLRDGSFDRDIGDIVMRSDGQLFSLTLDLEDIGGSSDAQAGNYILIDTGDGTITAIGDDGIVTLENDPAGRLIPGDLTSPIDPDAVKISDVGVHFNGLAFGENNVLYAVGDRGDFNPAGVEFFRNLLYRINGDTGAALNTPARNPAFLGSGTTPQAIGEILTSARFFAVNATESNGPVADVAQSIIDGLTFTIDVNGTPGDPLDDLVFEFDSGPDVRIANIHRVADGAFFVLERNSGAESEIFQFDTGANIVFAPNVTGAKLDGESITVEGFQADGTTVTSETYTFTTESAADFTGAGIPIFVAANSSSLQLAQALRTELQTAFADGARFNVQPSGTGTRIVLSNDTSVGLSAGILPMEISVEGGYGVAPVLGTVAGDLINDGTTFNLSARGFDTDFQFDSGFYLQVPATGGATVGLDGQTFTIFRAGESAVTFQFADAAPVTPGNVAIPFAAADSQADIANAIVAQIALRTELGLSPVNVGSGEVIVGGTGAEHRLEQDPANVVTLSEGAINSAFWLRAPALGGAEPGLDGQIFEITVEGGSTVRFEFTSDATFDPANKVIGFSLADTQQQLGQKIFQALADEASSLNIDPNDSGKGLVFVGATGENNVRAVFAPSLEIIRPSAVVPVSFFPDASFTADQVAQSVADAINRAQAELNFLDATARAVEDKVIVTGLDLLFFATTSPLLNLTNNLTVQIGVEEDFTRQEFAEAIDAAQPEFGGAVDRANFSTWETGDFVGVVGGFDPNTVVPFFTPFTGVDSIGGVASGNVAVDFVASDSANDIASRMAAAISALSLTGVSVFASGRTVELDGAEPISADAPITIDGEGPGGTVTGLEFIGGELYAVSDRGGLWRVPINDPFAAEYIATSKTDFIDNRASNISFASLTLGPQNVEGGIYSDLLFAIDTDGELFAFNTDGELQPIFLDAQTSVQTGLSNVNGLSFSTLDRNLWSITDNRSTDPGHGLNVPFDDSRAATQGGLSFYFGNEPLDNQDDYDFPGGAHGSLISNTFSLLEYEAADQPVLYFNYFLETEDRDYNPFTNPTLDMLDSFRVFASGDDGQWYLLSTNDSFRSDTFADEFDLGLGAVQETFDNSDSWRQARIDLAPFAGQDNLRLRFDFSTAGSMNLGDIQTTGSELRALGGDVLRDGDIFQIDSEVFEFEMGLTLVTSTLAAIQDGDTFTIDGVTFEFDTASDGLDVGTREEVDLTPGLSAGEIANRISTAITASSLGGAITIYQNGNRLNLQGALAVTQSGTALIVDGIVGPNGVGGTQLVPIHAGMTAEEVARRILTVMDATFAGSALVFPVNSLMPEANDTITNAIDSGFVMGVPSIFQGSGEIGDNGALTLAGTDVDMIEISLAAGTTIRVDIDADEFGTGLDSILRIFDDLGNELAVSDDAPAPGEQFSFDSYLSFTAPSAGTYYVGISAYSNFSYDALVAESGTDSSSLGTYEVEFSSAEQAGSSSKRFRDIIKVIGHSVVDQGPLGLATELEGDSFGGFNSPQRGQRNNFEGVYIDDLIIGFAERGEMVTAATSNTTYESNPEVSLLDILVGEYQLEVRQSSSYAFSVPPPSPTLILTRSFDTNDRLGQAVTITAPSGAEIFNGQTFLVSDGVATVTFEFVDFTGAGTFDPQHTPIFFDPSATSAEIADLIHGAINSPEVQAVLNVTSGTFDSSVRVELFGGSTVTSATGISTIDHQAFDELGDSNQRREQGQLLLQSNRISHSAEFAIMADFSSATTATRTLLELNEAGFVSGLTITNNLITSGGLGGVRFAGDAATTGVPNDVVPFGRLINNTLFGMGGTLLDLSNLDDVGISVENNASPTILNNIVANFGTGVRVDSTSQTTVLGGTLYQGNGNNTDNIGLGSFAIELQNSDPLFVSASRDNFILDIGSQAIDSSINALEDRNEMVEVNQPMGIGFSPILAPDRDLVGLLRVDDPAVATPDGFGENVFKDRGALDRADFFGPSAVLLTPRDNDSEGNDLDPTDTVVQLSNNTTVSLFTIQLIDTGQTADDFGGVGIDDGTVNNGSVMLFEDDVLLVLGEDYNFSYDTTNHIIQLEPLAGVWVPGSTYRIVLDNDPTTGIADLANNPLRPNQVSGETTFTIILGEVMTDFGDAPDPSYPTFAINDGARHVIANNLFLGATVDEDPDGQPNAAATGDGADEDGVTFDTSLLPGEDVTTTVIASADGLLNAWFDFDQNGSWTDPGEQIFTNEALVAGSNELVFSIPAGANLGNTYARFRFSSMSDLAPTGLAPDGEVEDYRIEVIERLFDFGDAPDPGYPTLLAGDGARHILGGTLFLGSTVDSEADGQPSAAADGDGADEDGVSFGIGLEVGVDATITVIASEGGLLDAWIDFDNDGVWEAGEQIFTNVVLVTGANALTVPIPVTAVRDTPTFARFRVSTAGDLTPSGVAQDGEVEDYQVTITGNPWQNTQSPVDTNGFGVDVNANGIVEPLDALLVINELNNPVFSNPSTGELPDTPIAPNLPPPFVDVDGDGFVTPLDAVLVINYLLGTTVPPPLRQAPLVASALQSSSTVTGISGSDSPSTATTTSTEIPPAMLASEEIVSSPYQGAIQQDDSTLGSSNLDDETVVSVSLEYSSYTYDVMQEEEQDDLELQPVGVEAMMEEIAYDVDEAWESEDPRDSVFADLLWQ